MVQPDNAEVDKGRLVARPDGTLPAAVLTTDADYPSSVRTRQRVDEHGRHVVAEQRDVGALPAASDDRRVTDFNTTASAGADMEARRRVVADQIDTRYRRPATGNR